MSDQGSSYRQILRSSSIIGGASVINIVLGIIRMKAVAVLLGPAGVGMIGLLTNLVTVATSIAGLGLGNAGVRQIAEADAKEDLILKASSRHALYLAALMLAIIGTLVFWLLRDVLAVQVLHDRSFADELGWLSLAVGFAVAASSQNALLNGLRRISDLSRVSIMSALATSIFGILALTIMGENGVLIFILAGPIASFITGHIYVSRIPKIDSVDINYDHIKKQWLNLVRLGVFFMISGLVLSISVLIIRSLIKDELGLIALGHFEAAWLISMTYIGFVLGSMGADYYPRLTAVIGNNKAINKMINDQTEVALLLASPMFLAMMGLAPWVIEFMYTKEFLPAVGVLRWQILGDILKIVSWPMSYLIIAAGDGKTYVITETLALLIFITLTFILLPIFGIEASGISFFGMYAIYLPLVYWLAKRRSGFYWRLNIVKHLFVLIFSALTLMVLAKFSSILSAVFGIILFSAFSIYSLLSIAKITKIGGRLEELSIFIRNVLYKIGFIK